jgi:hypothetical protein
MSTSFDNAAYPRVSVSYSLFYGCWFCAPKKRNDSLRKKRDRVFLFEKLFHRFD